jgi:bifunctional non-homologous end joining protein LigD
VPLPRFTPIAPTKIGAPFDHDDFAFELKQDGYRGLLYLERGRPAQLVSRRDLVLARFDGLATALAKRLQVGDVVLDGEVICIDAEGRSQFNALSRRGAEPFFYAFDVLWLDGQDVREQTLRERRALLQHVVPAGAPEICVADQIVGAGIDLFAEICRRDLEGMVAKPLDSPYAKVRGRSPWFKVLNPDYSQKRGRAEAFNRRR